jgi:hypothetical protein
MPVERYFFMMVIAVGIASGVFLVIKPEAGEASLPPYLWLFVCMLVFETAAFLRGKGAPGTMIGMSTRVIGFAIGMALMTAIVFFTGSPARLF